MQYEHSNSRIQEGYGSDELFKKLPGKLGIIREQLRMGSIESNIELMLKIIVAPSNSLWFFFF